MRLTEQFAAALFEAAPDAIVIVRHGIIVGANPEAERLLGGALRYIEGARIEAFVPDRHSEDHNALRSVYEQNPHRRLMGNPTSRLALKRFDGAEVPVEIALAPVEMHGEQFTIAIMRDVTERSRIEERLVFLSTRDPLTGLYNRRFFEEELTRATQGRHFPMGLVVVDINDLKFVNDTRGHVEGDQLIVRAARVLQHTFRADDVIARLGGDEFAVLVVNGDVSEPRWLTDRLAEVLAEDNRSNPDMKLSLAVGVRPLKRGDSLAHAMTDADALMYADKRSRRNT